MSEQQQCVRQMDVVVLLIQHTALLIWARLRETNHPSVFQHYHIDQSSSVMLIAPLLENTLTTTRL